MSQFQEKMDIHSPAWVFQTWASFAVSVGTTGVGIAYLPVDHWIQAFLGMGLLFTVGSTLNLAKTVRDLHESKRQSSKMDSLV
ncbi:YiaA/YiaB family inner membrane protein [Singulisphaera sp. PoT]|uniref:YiaA/YiaB family inner membrane protein n=1 Tax=Singulisphaera sp. PoT TaxID=3411797 RepID=UPI003BF48E61